jgi:hypothetical protein
MLSILVASPLATQKVAKSNHRHGGDFPAPSDESKDFDAADEVASLEMGHELNTNRTK